MLLKMLLIIFELAELLLTVEDLIQHYQQAIFLLLSSTSSFLLLHLLLRKGKEITMGTNKQKENNLMFASLEFD
jgi:hypothetical protein